MECPKCQHTMEIVTFDGIEIDRCTHCYGIWFDHLEQDGLKKLKGAESIDIGDEFIGAKFDAIRDVVCPTCKTLMTKVTHEGNSEEGFDEGLEITFERCKSCKGSFFDAGEFRDYMAEEIFEDFSDFLTALDN